MITQSLLDLRKFVAPEFVFGDGASSLVSQYARNLGAERVFLVSDPGVAEAGWARQVEKALRNAGFSVTLFTDITPNPRDTEAMAGAEEYRRNNCNAIAVVGGGSPMDCAKGIGIAVSNDAHVLDFEGVDNVDRPGPPLLCLPTTSGTSADVSQFAIILDTVRKVKIAIVSKKVVPDVSLLDPVLTTTMDPTLTAFTGLDALTHAVEAYVSNASSPVTDLFALESIRLVSQHLMKAIHEPHDLEARAGMLLGSLYAGLAFSNAILGAVHALAHSLGGLMDLPHGQCNAILLDHVMKSNFDAAPRRHATIGSTFGAHMPVGMGLDEQKDITLETIRTFKKAAGVTQQLAALGVSRSDLPNLADFALADPCMATNPREFNKDDVVSIYEQAL